MEQKHRTILRHHWYKIRENLEPKNILPQLVTVLKETDYQEIRAQSTRQERCDMPLDILLIRGKNAFNVFVNALVEEVPHLASELTEAGNNYIRRNLINHRLSWIEVLITRHKEGLSSQPNAIFAEYPFI